MPKGIRLVRYARYWLTVLTVSLILISLGSIICAMAATAAGSVSLSWLAQADDLAEAQRLNAEVERLYSAGKYDEAMPLAERALVIYEKALGPDHPYVATPLNNLALLYYNKGDYAKAEPQIGRASCRERV